MASHFKNLRFLFLFFGIFHCMAIFFYCYSFFKSRHNSVETTTTAALPNTEFIKVNKFECYNRSFKSEILQHGNYFVLKNFIKASHGNIACNSQVTFVTHADFTFLANVIPLVKRWQAPISLAIYAPSADFQSTLNSIIYLRKCAQEQKLVRMFVTFHLYFDAKFFPKSIPKSQMVDKLAYKCQRTAPYSAENINQHDKFAYPVNVGRNIARDAALTHFILSADIELLPNANLASNFLKMINNDIDKYLTNAQQLSVFVLPIFEISSDSSVPKNKAELVSLIRKRKADTFHKFLCKTCHMIPKYSQWLYSKITAGLEVFYTATRANNSHWEPIYIGTNAEPFYDERLNWEGKRDKMMQMYAMCVLNYDFLILNNAFLVHKPGIKKNKRNFGRLLLTQKTYKFIFTKIYPELRKLYGSRIGCEV